MKHNPLLDLQKLGQSIWLDYLRRGMIVSGELDELIENDGLRGMTSNPAIFEKAISGSHDYDRDVRTLALEDLPPQRIYERLAVKDIQMVADKFRPLYDQSEGRHGFVSLEVNPRLARDTQGTIDEARRLWLEVDRPNVMIKVPATEEGLPAIQQLTREGINVNITLLFGLPRYQKVAWAYIHGLEERAAQGEPLDRIASVASFFLSRIDVLVDPQLEKIEKKAGQQAGLASRLHGKVAISSAKVAYQLYQQIFNSQSFQQLRQKGARTQRLLWASTGTKNPAYSDIKYVQHLIGPETVNTVPAETLNAFRDHGKAESTLEKGLEDAQEVLENLNDLGTDLDEVTQQLEDEGIEKFNHPFDRLMETLQAEIDQAQKEPVDRQTLHLGSYQGAFQDRVNDLDEKRFASRLWKKDSSLWKADPEDERLIINALGWLHVPEKMVENLSELEKFAREIHQAGFQNVVHLGMGGSSLAPMLFALTFKPGGEGLPLTVLDTTDPATILDLESRIPLKDTLFIVASKSGKTAETSALADFFYAELQAIKGSRAGENFVAITDPGTPLQEMAKQRAFRHTFLNFTDIGGRYSALSYFGLLPAVLLGVDVNELLERSLRMLHACSSCVPARENPGMLLGAAIGQLALQGRDKLTILTPEPVSAFGMWLEQLLAESTGKEGTGILPVAGEVLGDPTVYGPDRVFVYFRLKGEEDPAWEKKITELEAAEHPVITIQLDDLLDLGQEFVRWEIATATAGAILGINAFNQPDVQESKDNTNRLLEKYESQKHLPDEKPAIETQELSLFTKEPADSAAATLTQFLGEAEKGDYIAIMAYLQETPETEFALQSLRHALRDNLHLATTLGYGPRFLHSTSQLHKGGPNRGVFLQLTTAHTRDVQIPGKAYTFGTLIRAQALGDLQALRKHNRRVLRIQLEKDILSSLDALLNMFETSLSQVEGAI